MNVARWYDDHGISALLTDGNTLIIIRQSLAAVDGLFVALICRDETHAQTTSIPVKLRSSSTRKVWPWPRRILSRIQIDDNNNSSMFER